LREQEFNLSESSFERIAHGKFGQRNQNVELASRKMNFVMAGTFHPIAAFMGLKDAFG